MKYKAAIFDMDGTIIDSTWVWTEVYGQYFRQIKHTNLNINSKDIMHMTPTELAKYIKKELNLAESYEELKSKWLKLAYSMYINKVRLKKGAKRLLGILKNNKISLSLATACYVELTEKVLKKHGVYYLFDYFAYSDVLGVNKSSADIYLISAKKMKVNPNECAIFEDISAPIQHVKEHGMGYFAIDDLRQSDKTKKILQKYSDMYIYDFDKFIDSGNLNKYFEICSRDYI